MRRWCLDGLIHYAGRFLSCVKPSFHQERNPHLPLHHTHRCVKKKTFAALCLCKPCGLNCKNFLVLFPCTAAVRGKSESGTGGESTATKIKDSTASVTEIKTKKSEQREGGRKKDGREWQRVGGRPKTASSQVEAVQTSRPRRGGTGGRKD